MKRKRGSKAGKKKGKKKEVASVPATSPVCVNAEDNITLDQSNDSRLNSEMDIEPPSLASEMRNTVSTIDVDAPDNRSKPITGYRRVRVKLRSSKVLEPHRSSSDAQTPSDAGQNSLQTPVEIKEAPVEKEDSVHSDGQTSEIKDASEYLPRKPSSIKIKSSKGLGLSSETVQDKDANKLNSPLQKPNEGNPLLVANEKSTDSAMPRIQIKSPFKDPRYNEKELATSLAVIKKVMKMDAAVPFNTPVNPVALGIPDYFDIIDTPMDFGTICHDLEQGQKYMNSEDVYKDVQFIWQNCYKYNKKGDYIVDLMKRVKKNFMKYWLAEGLYFDARDNGSTDHTQIEEAMRSSQDKVYSKVKPKHKRRRYAIDRHKSDCLCAVCVVRRRRKEREESQIAITNSNLSQQFKLEENSPVDNPCSEDVSSSLDHSPDTRASGDIEEAENDRKVKTPEQLNLVQQEKQEPMGNEMELDHNGTCSTSQPSQLVNLEDGTEDSNPLSDEQELECKESDEQEDDVSSHQKEDIVADQHHEESSKKCELLQTEESPVQEENHSVLQICTSLFPSNRRSVWRGPHSLAGRPVSLRDGPIRSAVAAIMKQY
ncbi:uncharacterized protein [Typha angustifolia]|uniref:uncharacterized protein isoform X2 n=1 Tax=Typha angustifolia TaxID=59011 RepID=UPI003C30ACF1